MPTSIRERELRSDFRKSKAMPSGVRTGLAIVLFCMIGLVASLVLFSILMGAPDLSDIGQLIGP